MQIQPCFQFISDWYRKKAIRATVAQYYWTIRSILKEKPHLRKYLTRCRHCHILFFTHPRNEGRHDLGCPFGCREAYRKKRSTLRSIEYYRTKDGKGKKKDLNAARSRQDRLPESIRDENGNDDCGSKIDDENGNDDCGSKIDDEIVCHIQVVTSLVEGRFVGLAEIFAMVDKILRQHSIDMDGKLVYAVICHLKGPP